MAARSRLSARPLPSGPAHTCAQMPSSGLDEGRAGSPVLRFSRRSLFLSDASNTSDLGSDEDDHCVFLNRSPSPLRRPPGIRKAKPLRRSRLASTSSISTISMLRTPSPAPSATSDCPSPMNAFDFAALSFNDAWTLSGDGKPCSLPVVRTSQEDLRCISPDTLADMLRGVLSVGKFLVVDCRFDYEFAGGHVSGALNLSQVADLAKLFFHAPVTDPTARPAIIFHCEFSSHRAPTMCRALRSLDRSMHIYPEVQYPELYVLHGGYKAFFEAHPTLCVPQAYVPMRFS